MPEVVGADAGDPGLRAASGQDLADGLAGHVAVLDALGPVHRAEQRAVAGQDVDEPGVDPGGGAGVDIDRPLLVALPDDLQGAGRGVVVRSASGDDVGAAQAGLVHQRVGRGVTDASGGEGFQTRQLELGDVLVRDGSADRLAVAGDRLDVAGLDVVGAGVGSAGGVGSWRVHSHRRMSLRGRDHVLPYRRRVAMTCSVNCR
jgi:hypothetical protein